MKKYIIIAMTAAALMTGAAVYADEAVPAETVQITAEATTAPAKTAKPEAGNKKQKKTENKHNQEHSGSKKENSDACIRMREMKQLVKEKKIETHEYLREMRATFPDIEKEERKELLAEIAAAKAELKDFRIDTFVHGHCINFDKYDKVYPVIENNRTLVPVRAIVESLGANVEWNGETQEITLSKEGVSVKMTIGSTTAYVNGEATELEAPPTIRNNRTLVPARLIAESFSLSTQWDENSKSVIIE